MQKNFELHKINAITIFGSGHQALAEIDGLRVIAFRGMFFNYLIFFVVSLFLNGLFYSHLLGPFITLIFGRGHGLWASVGTIVLWGIQLTVAAVFAMISLRFSIEMLSFWHQGLVQRIIKHFRQIKVPVFSYKAWFGEIKYFFKEALKACLFPFLLIFVGLIPVIGLPIVFLLESHMFGRGCVEAYLESLSNPEEAAKLRKKWRWLPIRIGWLPAVLTFIPFFGWLFLPLSLTYEVIGFAFLVEKSRNNLLPEPSGSPNTT